MRNGVPTRLVPSLDGTVYQLNEESIEALPFSADTLLSSSFKLNEDLTIVGGKESLTYGIETRTGKVSHLSIYQTIISLLCTPNIVGKVFVQLF